MFTGIHAPVCGHQDHFVIYASNCVRCLSACALTSVHVREQPQLNSLLAKARAMHSMQQQQQQQQQQRQYAHQQHHRPRQVLYSRFLSRRPVDFLEKSSTIDHDDGNAF